MTSEMTWGFDGNVCRITRDGAYFVLKVADCRALFFLRSHLGYGLV